MNMITHRHLLLLSLLGLLSAPACRIVPESDYLKRYENNFADAALPSSPDILKDGLAQSFKAPPNEVWRTVLRIAAQTQGVLAADGGAGGDAPRRVMVLDGHRLVVWQQASQGGVDATTFLDTWLAITVVPDGPDATKVAVAWVSPQTNKVAAFPPPPAGEKRTASIANTIPAFKNSAIRTQRLFIAQARAEDFLHSVGIQLYRPQQWLARLQCPPPTPRGLAPAVKTRDDPGYPELKNDYGNWCSLLLRRNTCIVDCPELVGELTRILNNLKKAAGKENMPTRVFVMASSEVNAFSLPNGDIFICAGLLDLLEDTQQVAAVLAHELDHYAQHDAVHKIQNEYTAQVISVTVMVTISVAGGVAGGLMTVPSSIGATVSPGAQLMSSLIQQAAGQVATYTGMGLEDTIVMGYSQEVELRADNNGLRYVWAAGYDPQGMMQVMTKLKDIEVAARDMKANCGSALVNCKPGVEKRTGELQNVLGELKKSP
jgi:Zn-dependent protease with chaperone function